MLKLAKNFLEQSQDFGPFLSKAASNDANAAKELVRVAQEAHDHSMLLFEEFLLASLIDSEAGKRTAETILASRVGLELALIETSLKWVNNYTSAPIQHAIVVHANELKKDLGQLQERLQAISRRLAKPSDKSGIEK